MICPEVFYSPYDSNLVSIAETEGGKKKCKLFHPEDVRMLRITSLTLTCYNHTCFLLYFSLICFILQVRFKDSEDSTKEIAALIKGRYKDQSGMCE